MKNGLKALRESRGWNQLQAAEKFGYSYEGYKKLELGQRRLRAEHIQRAYEIYGASEAEILGRSNTVRLVGHVGAGNEAHYYAGSDERFDEVERPPESSDNTVATEIRGDSMYPIASDGDILYYDDLRTPPTDDIIGKLCVICTVDQKILVKRLHRGRSPDTYDLHSANAPPIESVRVEWAARVKWIKPK